MQNNPILKKQMAIQYAGGSEDYEQFKRMMGASKLLYSHDLHVYNDDVNSRHARNIQELKLLKQLLTSGKIQPSMLAANTFNTFYPSFVLHHHYDIFLPLLRQVNTPEIKDLVTASLKHETTGAVLEQKYNWALTKTVTALPTINEEGEIAMQKDTFFYSGASSPYLTHAIFWVSHSGTQKLAIVEVRNKEGKFGSGVKVKDFGGTISHDYLPVGYNFNGVKPIAIISVNEKKKRAVKNLVLREKLHDFQHSIRDLQKSLWITIEYTKMRKQFRTIQGSKDERSIITYQAVASRIIDGFSTLLSFSAINTRLQSQPFNIGSFIQLIQSSHHVILQKLVHLRECCGGFGYQQFSGHPGCIERVAFRAGIDQQSAIDFTNPKFLLSTQYYTSSEQAEQFYSQPITSEKPSYMNFFGIFISICCNMRKNHESMTLSEFKREYLQQSGLMATHAREEFSRHEATNIHCLILQYGIANYIIKNSQFISWDLIQIDRQVFYNSLNEYKSKLLEDIAANLVELGSTLELNFLRNVVIGRANEKEFYSELLQASRKNLRNSPSYLAYIRQPIVEMLVTNRAKL